MKRDLRICSKCSHNKLDGNCDMIDRIEFMNQGFIDDFDAETIHYMLMAKGEVSNICDIRKEMKEMRKMERPNNCMMELEHLVLG